MRAPKGKMIPLIDGRELRRKDECWKQIREIEKRMLQANPLNLATDFAVIVYIIQSYNLLPPPGEGEPPIAVTHEEILTEALSRVRNEFGKEATRADLIFPVLSLLGLVAMNAMTEIGRQVVQVKALKAKYEPEPPTGGGPVG